MIQPGKLIIGTRGSTLALTQTRWLIRLLQNLLPDVQVEERIVRTEGDRVQNVPLSQFDGRGVFVRELENALASGEIDAAVHSLKDLPSQMPAGFHLAAVPVREDPRDALICRSAAGLEDLPDGAVVGTGSPRRRAQLAALRPGLQFKEIRGNIDTRLRKLNEGDYDALVLACAGLNRLKMSHTIGRILEPHEVTPAVGQGALALECREVDPDTIALLKRVTHPETLIAVQAERAVARKLKAGCHTPLGVLGQVIGPRALLMAVLADPLGKTVLKAEAEGSAADPVSLGERVAETLLAQGGGALLEGPEVSGMNS